MRTYKEQTALILEKANQHSITKKKRMKYIYSLSTVAACLLIVLSVYTLPMLLKNPVEPPVIPTEPDNIVIDYKSMLYFVNEYISPNLKESLEDTGGIEYLSYTYPLDIEYLFIDSRLTEYVGEDKYREWTHAEAANGNYLYVNILTYIEHFNLTKDQFLEACFMYPTFPLWGDDTYDIADKLFADDIETVLRFAKADSAVYSNGKLYSAEWLDTHTVEDYLAEKIYYTELENAKEATLSAIRDFSKNDENLYKEKLEVYKNMQK